METYYVYIKPSEYEKGEMAREQCKWTLEGYLLAYGGEVIGMSKFVVKHPNFQIKLDPLVGDSEYFRETLEDKLDFVVGMEKSPEVKIQKP